MYGKGISKEGSLLDVGVDLEIVKKSGAWFTYEGEQLGQGRENARRIPRGAPRHSARSSGRCARPSGLRPSARATTSRSGSTTPSRRPRRNRRSRSHQPRPAGRRPRRGVATPPSHGRGAPKNPKLPRASARTPRSAAAQPAELERRLLLLGSSPARSRTWSASSGSAWSTTRQPSAAVRRLVRSQGGSRAVMHTDSGGRDRRRIPGGDGRSGCPGRRRGAGGRCWRVRGSPGSPACRPRRRSPACPPCSCDGLRPRDRPARTGAGVQVADE